MDVNIISYCQKCILWIHALTIPTPPSFPQYHLEELFNTVSYQVGGGGGSGGDQGRLMVELSTRYYRSGNYYTKILEVNIMGRGADDRQRTRRGGWGTDVHRIKEAYPSILKLFRQKVEIVG